MDTRVTDLHQAVDALRQQVEQIEKNPTISASANGHDHEITAKSSASTSKTRIRHPGVVSVSDAVSDTDTRWIHSGYVSIEYPEKNKYE